MKSIILLLAATGLFTLGTACTTSTEQTKIRGVQGALGGAIVGGVIGHQSGRGLEGAAVGAAAGGALGATYGSAEDEAGDREQGLRR